MCRLEPAFLRVHCEISVRMLVINRPRCADNRIRHIPVVEGKGMKGMVSIGDVVRAVVDEHREELQRLSSFIQGGY